MSVSETNDVSSDMEGAREYAWNWFELHAKQRQQSFHFYIILITGILGAYFISLRFGPAPASQSYSPIPLLLSIAAMVFSYLFYRLDRRNRVLVRYAESALAAFEGHYSGKLGPDLAPKFVDLAAKSSSYQDDHIAGLTTYGDIYRVIFAMGFLGGFLSLVTSWPPQGIGRLLNSLFV